MGMMKNLANRLGPYNISVNDVAPAMVGNTGMIPNSEAVPGVVDTIPLNRLCTPEEVANVVRMFCHDGVCDGAEFGGCGGVEMNEYCFTVCCMAVGFDRFGDGMG